MENLPGSIDAILGMLAERFGTTIEHLWSVLIRQAFVTGIIEIAMIVGSIIAIVYAVKYVRAYEFVKTDYRGEDPRPDDDAKHMAWFIAAMASLIPAMIIAASVGTVIGKVFNPEFWALQQVLKLFGGG